MFSNFRSKLRSLRRQSVKPRHYVVILLVVFIVLFALLIASSTTVQARPFHLVQITYSTGDASSGVYYADALTELKVDIGYFASCIQTNYLNNVNDWNCGANETHLLLTDTNYSSTSTANVDLMAIFLSTAKEFRQYCLTPYVVVVALALSLVTLVMFAFSSPSSAPKMYKYAAIVCFIGFATTLVAAVWQETNILTAVHLMQDIHDDYYTMTYKYNLASRVFVWCGVGIMLLTTGLLAFLAMIGQIVETVVDDMEKM